MARPAVRTIGAATKDYHDPALVEKILGATKRNIVVQTVRDPIESFVAQTNNTWFTHRFAEITGKGRVRETVEELIEDAVTRFITPAAAEAAYEVDSFRQHIIVDVEDLKGDKTEGAVEALWLALCGDASPANRVSNYYKPIGSRSFAKLREFGGFQCSVPGGPPLLIFAIPEGDLWTGFYDATANIYRGREQILKSYPDAAAMAPALRLTGTLNMCAFPHEWCAIHPTMRAALLPVIAQSFEAHIHRVNEMFSDAEKAMDFTLESLTPAQAQQLRVGIESDFRTFMRRHPAAAERWSVTRGFLGL